MKGEYYCKPGCEPERYGTGWLDLKTADNCSFKKGELVTVDFGIIINFPRGIEGILVPRSSTLTRHGLIMSGFGVIDNEYKGPEDFIGGRFYTICDGFIPKGTRLCQLRIQKNMSNVDFTQTEAPNFQNKSRGGFGSTGRLASEMDYDDGFVAGVEYAIRNKITE